MYSICSNSRFHLRHHLNTITPSGARFISTRSAIHKGLRSSQDRHADPRQRSNSRAQTSKHTSPWARSDYRALEDRPRHFASRDSRQPGESRERRFGSEDTRGPPRERPSFARSRQFGDERPSRAAQGGYDRSRTDGVRAPPGKRSTFGDRRPPGRQGAFGAKGQTNDRTAGRAGTYGEKRQFDRVSSYKPGTNFAEKSPDGDRGAESNSPRITKITGHREDFEDGVPLSVPRTKAASVFLYGFNSVIAALKGKRRKMYKLYLGASSSATDDDDSYRAYGKMQQKGDGRKRALLELKSLAADAGIQIQESTNSALLSRMSEKRPHNGVVLEASRIPAPPLNTVGRNQSDRRNVPLVLEKQRQEDQVVNGTPKALKVAANSWRHALIVFLDGITDPGNLGSIIRTCHFYGVDAVAIATNTCANIASPIVAKASAGASEGIPIFQIPKPAQFLRTSGAEGWKIFAAMAPDSTDGEKKPYGNQSTGQIASQSPLAFHPSILVLGAEGEGLRENLQARADGFVSILGGSGVQDVGVDSVNVSVAAGILVEAFLRKPVAPVRKSETRTETPAEITTETHTETSAGIKAETASETSVETSVESAETLAETTGETHAETTEETPAEKTTDAPAEETTEAPASKDEKLW